MFRFQNQHPAFAGLLDAKGRWNGNVNFVVERLGQPLQWSAPRGIFVDSLSDLFYEQFTFAQIAAVFGVMAVARQHRFMVLTKREDRLVTWFGWVSDAADNVGKTPAEFCCEAAISAIEADAKIDPNKRRILLRRLAAPGGAWPLDNVALGVSVEDQAAAELRVEAILSVPAAIRAVSAEPALSPIRLDAVPIGGRRSNALPRLDLVIPGGESGAGARESRVEVIVDLVDQCVTSGVPVFVKQLGARPTLRGEPLRLKDRKGEDWTEWPEELERIKRREFPPAWESASTAALL